MSEMSSSSYGSRVRPRHAFVSARECRCKKGECLIFTSRQEHSKGRRFYCCPFNRTPQDCNFFEWIDEPSHSTVDLKYQLIDMELSIEKKYKMLKKYLLIVIVLQFLICGFQCYEYVKSKY
ncbi:hypothetical protein QJS04_geneDACA002010 [Acorus gramineus]|uniref:GRF-type domain-containing protein n=1 Tax=Acorus gramineus TaxID=55184 RepID=A0AAV9A784_ACOGR|nr:hypothetical protein QJS04_geneDACA002010 [Acorus gramineus]